MTTCPSGVHYMHLIDDARVHVEKTYQRPLPERCSAAARLRHAAPGLFSWRSPRRGSASLRAAFGRLGFKPVAALLDARSETPACLKPLGAPGTYPAEGRQAPRRIAAGLRRKACSSRHQRSGHPAAQSPRHRGGGHGGRGLLRIAHPSHGQGRWTPSPARGAWSTPGWPRLMSTPSSSPRRAAARRSRTMAHAAARSGLCREGRARFSNGEGYQRISPEPRACRTRPGRR